MWSSVRRAEEAGLRGPSSTGGGLPFRWVSGLQGYVPLTQPSRVLGLSYVAAHLVDVPVSCLPSGGNVRGVRCYNLCSRRELPGLRGLAEVRKHFG